MRRFPSGRGSVRSFGRSKLCVLLILGIGFVLIFSYLAQTHDFGIRDGKYFRHGALEGTPSGNTSPLSSRNDSLNSKRSAIQIQDIVGNLTERRPSRPPTSRSGYPPPKKDPKRVKERFLPSVQGIPANVLSAKFSFVIKVLSLNNYSSLVRCLDSLSEAKYSGDMVDIHIYIDHFDIKESSTSSENRRRLLLSEEPEQKKVLQMDNAERVKAASEDTRLEDDRISTLPDRVTSGSESVDRNDWNSIEQKLEIARQMLDYAETFLWRHGKKFIHYSTTRTGLQSQWVDAWWPSSDDEFALFVEDDAEVSPLYYRYVRALIATYYYEPSNFDSSLYGISLQRAQIVPGKFGRPVKISQGTRLFKYQMLGTCGQVFFPKPWKDFRVWYDSKKNHAAKPIVDGMVTTDWYEKHGEAVFTPWFVKFAYNRGYFNLYTNFLKKGVLSVAHREFEGKPNKFAGNDSVLLWKNGTFDIDLWHMAAAWNIKQYDYCFKEMKHGTFAKSFAEAELVFGRAPKTLCQDGKEILLVSTFGVTEILVRNWVCRAKSLNISNYVLVGEDFYLLQDLARRGLSCLFVENKRNSTWSLEKEVKTIAEVFKFDYAVWLTRADTVWDRNLLHAIDTGGSDIIGLEENFPALNLVFVRCTNLTVPLWQSLTRDLAKVNVNDSRPEAWERARHKFVKGFRGGMQTRIHKLEKVSWLDGMKLANLSPPGTSTDAGTKRILVLADWPSDSSLQWQLKAKAEELGFWNLDDDWACSKLTC